MMTLPAQEMPPADAAPTAEASQPDVMDPVEAAQKLKRFIRCRPGRPRNYCNGTGIVTAIVNGARNKVICVCIENAIKQAEEAKAAASATRAAISEMGARADGLEPPPAPPGRQVPVPKRHQLEQLEREMDRAWKQIEDLGTATAQDIEGLQGELVGLTAEEADNKRATVQSEAAKMLAGASLEEARARLEGLRATIAEADAELELRRAQAGQFGARRMTIEAQIEEARARHTPELKAASTRFQSLRYRHGQLLSRWPELRPPTS
jgi:DNA repair exonuclease SbcCD ATPase subunit